MSTTTRIELVRGRLPDVTTQDMLLDGTTTSVGAVSTFCGVTRGDFEGKRVIELEYEAYEEMAVRTLHSIVREARQSHPELACVVILHRLGLCPVNETSLFVGCTSAHREACLQAVPWLVDELKLRAPIWKLERYGDGEPALWKQNQVLL